MFWKLKLSSLTATQPSCNSSWGSCKLTTSRRTLEAVPRWHPNDPWHSPDGSFQKLGARISTPSSTALVTRAPRLKTPPPSFRNSHVALLGINSESALYHRPNPLQTSPNPFKAAAAYRHSHNSLIQPFYGPLSPSKDLSKRNLEVS